VMSSVRRLLDWKQFVLFSMIDKSASSDSFHKFRNKTDVRYRSIRVQFDIVYKSSDLRRRVTASLTAGRQRYVCEGIRKHSGSQ